MLVKSGEIVESDIHFMAVEWVGEIYRLNHQISFASISTKCVGLAAGRSMLRAELV